MAWGSRCPTIWLEEGSHGLDKGMRTLITAIRLFVISSWVPDCSRKLNHINASRQTVSQTVQRGQRKWEGSEVPGHLGHDPCASERKCWRRRVSKYVLSACFFILLFFKALFKKQAQQSYKYSCSIELAGKSTSPGRACIWVQSGPLWFKLSQHGKTQCHMVPYGAWDDFWLDR